MAVKILVVVVLGVVVATVAQPPVAQKASYARWMVSSAEWGTLSTLSTLWEGFPFGNPVSVADVDGAPVFCVSPLDQSIQDLASSPKASLTLSRAAAGDAACRPPSGDPENPPCSRLVLAGTFANVTDDGWDAAKDALEAKHPAMEGWGCFDPDNDLDGHDFFLAKLDVEHAWLIDIYGGAAIIDPDDYFGDYDSSGEKEAAPLQATGFVGDEGRQGKKV